MSLGLAWTCLGEIKVKPRPSSKDAGSAACASAMGHASPMALAQARVHVGADAADKPWVERQGVDGGALGDYLSELHMVLLASTLLVGPLRVGEVDRAAAAFLHGTHIGELGPPISQDQPEEPLEPALADKLLDPIEGPHDMLRILALQQDVDLEPQRYEVHREQRLDVLFYPFDAIDLDNALPHLLVKGHIVLEGAAASDGAIHALLRLRALLVADLLAQIHLSYAYALVFHMPVKRALRARQILVGGEDVVNGLAAVQALPHDADEKSRLLLRHIDALAGFAQAALRLDLGCPCRIGPSLERAGRLLIASVANPRGTPGRCASLLLIALAPTRIAEPRARRASLSAGRAAKVLDAAMPAISARVPGRGGIDLPVASSVALELARDARGIDAELACDKG